MENNDNKNMSLLDILANKRTAYDQEVEARKNAVTQGILDNTTHWDGTAMFSPAEIAKENAKREEMVKNQEKYTQAADHILQESPSDAPLTAVNNYARALQLHNDREMAMQSLSEKDRIILLGHPDLQQVAYKQHQDKDTRASGTGVTPYTTMDVMADQRD